MLANIYMRQNGLMPVKWQEDLLAKENMKRDAYIDALKKANGGDYLLFVGAESKTADIEKQLISGVQGAKRVVFILT